MNMLKKWFPSKYLAATNIEEDEIVTVRKIVDEHVGQAQQRSNPSCTFRNMRRASS